MPYKPTPKKKQSKPVMLGGRKKTGEDALWSKPKKTARYKLMPKGGVTAKNTGGLTARRSVGTTKSPGWKSGKGTS